jgi:hypothetical protein
MISAAFSPIDLFSTANLSSFSLKLGSSLLLPLKIAPP